MIQDLQPIDHKVEDLAKTVVGLAMKVHRKLGPGFVESIYANALFVELRSAGIEAEARKRLNVYYHNNLVGELVADLVVQEEILIVIKTIESLTKAHTAQLINLFSAVHLDAGLLLNFGSTQFELELRRKSHARERAYLDANPINFVNIL